MFMMTVFFSFFSYQTAKKKKSYEFSWFANDMLHEQMFRESTELHSFWI